MKTLCDSDILEDLMKNPKNGVVTVPKRSSETEPERDWWLIDRALTIPENTTVVLQNCRIKLSDNCRDNFFRSANCGVGISKVNVIRSVHIKGEGNAVLEGADHPRSTGDSSKILACPCPKKPEDLIKYADWIPAERRTLDTLSFWDAHDHSYGTDANKEGERKMGDWRNIGILFARVENFSIENIKIVNPHGWAISLEDCAFGKISGIEFDACMAREIDGMTHNSENQDGIDLRNGCHDITICDITGGTGDDIIALTALCPENDPPRASGALSSTHILHNDWTRRSRDIYNIILRNVMGYSKGGLCWMVRLLAAKSRIYNVLISGIVDTSPRDVRPGGVILIGDRSYSTGERDNIFAVSVSDVLCDSATAFQIEGYLKDSVITNVINRNPDVPPFLLAEEDALHNVSIGTVSTVGEEKIALSRWENGKLMTVKVPEKLWADNSFTF